MREIDHGSWIEQRWNDGAVRIIENADAVCRRCEKRIWPRERAVVLDDGEVVSEHLHGADCGECRCDSCAEIHREFISAFGKWPSMTHREGEELADRRADNERSWDRAMRGER